MVMVKLFRFLVFTALLILSSCNSDRLNISEPNVQVDFKLVRIEQDWQPSADIQLFHEKYTADFPDLYAYYLGACLQVGRMEDSSTVENIRLFLEDSFMLELNMFLNQEFKDFAQVEDIKSAMKYLKYYYPEGKIPSTVATYNSAFSNSVISSPTEIGIGLERYLGEENNFIQQLPEQVFFQYIKRQMDARFLVRDVMMSWVSTNYFDEIQDDKTIAEQLIDWGKIYYTVEATIPAAEKDILLRYFPEDLQWALDNEKAFWNYLVEENVLFKREQKIARNIFGDGPFTPGLPIEEKAPARFGHFLGWRIVKSFMNSEKQVSVKDLADIDYKEILKSYKVN